MNLMSLTSPNVLPVRKCFTHLAKSWQICVYDGDNRGRLVTAGARAAGRTAYHLAIEDK